MAYVINKFSGEELIVLDDGTLDTTTSLGLVGRNYVGYGETQNENFLFLLENFANSAPPSRPIVGQIWFNTTDATAYAYDGTQWNPIGAASVSATTPTNNNKGALWLKTPVNQLFVYTGTEWRFIGPEAVEGFGSTRARSGSLDNTAGDPRPVIFLETNGTAFAICTASAFVINPSNSVIGFSNVLQAGINLSETAKINGSITGNAATADQLATARLINGVPFNASSNITVTANTTNTLKKGTYIAGSDFDGSVERTWSVDASSANLLGKVVARNSEGGFSAGTISATFVGDLTGNVTASSGVSTFNTVQANQFVGSQLTGNAATATRLATERSINGVNFDGTRNITVAASAETLTGNAINNSVTLSALTQVGTLSSLTVNDSGIFVGSGTQLRVFVDSSVPTIRSTTGRLNFDMGGSGPDINFVDSATSLSLGGPNAPAVIGDNNTNLGITGYKFNGIYANNLFGNAATATLSTNATNLVGGGLGAIAVQQSVGVTGFLGLGADNSVLRARPGGPIWEPLILEQLNKGSFINMANTTTSGSVNFFNSSVPVTISVDATSANTASKVVARDASGNFSAGTVSANLSLPTSGVISWPNDQYGGGGDIGRIDMYSGGGEAQRLRLYVNNDASDLIELDASGGVYITRGNVLSDAVPTFNNHLTNKLYVDQAIAGASYYDFFNNGVQSPGPQAFPQQTVRGFSAYSSTDFPGAYFGGITVSGPSGVYSGQIAFNWNSEETAPTGLYFRVNDDTSNTAAWSPWKQVSTTENDLVFTSGNTIYSTSGFTNQVGSWNNGANYFDVFPPAGKSMANLRAFIPSIAVIHYAGGVNGDDSMRCTWSNLGDRIRVYVQNTEQRSTPAANYLAIWR
jgi:hypothetical protein